MSIDQLRSLRTPAQSGPSAVYVRIHSFGLSVGITQTRCFSGPCIATMVIIQAALDNTAVIHIGGEECGLQSGLQLDPGKALLLSVTGFSDLTQSQVSQLFQSYGQNPAGSSGLMNFQDIYPLMVFDLRDIWAISSLPLQSIRGLWAVPPRF